MSGVPGFAEWQNVRESFWFLPAVMCLSAAVLAEVLVWLGGATTLDYGPLNTFIYRAGADGSRAVLGAIASSMLTVAATAFSITIAVLALTSSTYGPRLVRNFMADRGNQFTLGIFVATFLYSLLVLRSIRQMSLTDPTDEVFVPHLAVNVAVLLALVAVGVLVWFIHHISDSIQVWTLARRVRGELRNSVDHLYPELAGRGHGEVRGDLDGADAGGPAAQVRAPASGYVVEIDEKHLIRTASQHDVVVRLCVRPGVYCLAESVMAAVHPRDRANDDVHSAVHRAIALQESRSPYQDVEFAFEQMLELAVRALSPSMNDPYTAINALDDLSAELTRLMARDEPSENRYDDAGALRLVAPAVRRAALVDLTFDTVRTYALEHPMVLHRTVEVASRLGAATAERSMRSKLARHVDLLVEAYRATGPQQVDLAALRERADGVRAALTV